MQKLVRTLKDIHGGENHQKVLTALEHMHDIYLTLQMYPDAILNVQKKITIYKALNDQDVADLNIAKYLLQLGSVQGAVKKYDDALRNFREAEKIIKKLAPTDPQAKAEEESIKKAIEEMVAKQKKEEKGAPEKVVQNKAAAPNSNFKFAV